MNIRKNIDYTDMYAALDSAIEKNLSQVELYFEIGRAICQRTEKGAAVAAAAYLSEHYPDAQGFSPRNLRRMRDFCRTYEDHPDLLTLALQLGWTQNVVILEAGLSLELREWYMEAAKQLGWSKNELIEKIAANAYEETILTNDEKGCNILGPEKPKNMEKRTGFRTLRMVKPFNTCLTTRKGGRQRWYTMLWPISTAKRITYMRC